MAADQVKPTGLESFGPIEYNVEKSAEDLHVYGEAKELKDLHKDLQEANYTSKEMEDVIPPLNLLYQSPHQPSWSHEEERSSLEDSGDAFLGGYQSRDSVSEAPSLDAIFYEDCGSKGLKKSRKKYKRRDWVSLVPPGSPRRSTPVKARLGVRLLGMEEESI